jgi:hypothetical protein
MSEFNLKSKSLLLTICFPKNTQKQETDLIRNTISKQDIYNQIKNKVKENKIIYFVIGEETKDNLLHWHIYFRVEKSIRAKRKDFLNFVFQNVLFSVHIRNIDIDIKKRYTVEFPKKIALEIEYSFLKNKINITYNEISCISYCIKADYEPFTNILENSLKKVAKIGKQHGIIFKYDIEFQLKPIYDQDNEIDQNTIEEFEKTLKNEEHFIIKSNHHPQTNEYQSFLNYFLHHKFVFLENDQNINNLTHKKVILCNTDESNLVPKKSQLLVSKILSTGCQLGILNYKDFGISDYRINTQILKMFKHYEFDLNKLEIPPITINVNIDNSSININNINSNNDEIKILLKKIKKLENENKKLRKTISEMDQKI